jgi:hypothetical protein
MSVVESHCPVLLAVFESASQVVNLAPQGRHGCAAYRMQQANPLLSRRPGAKTLKLSIGWSWRKPTDEEVEDLWGQLLLYFFRLRLPPLQADPGRVRQAWPACLVVDRPTEALRRALEPEGVAVQANQPTRGSYASEHLPGMPAVPYGAVHHSIARAWT